MKLWYNTFINNEPKEGYTMKQSAQTISITKGNDGYTVSVKQGRKTRTFNLLTKNAARSFVRRNFAQRGHY